LREALVQAVGRVCPPWLANDREDIVQVALAKLMENAARDRTELEFSKAYLRKVAYSHVVDEIRRRRRRRESSLEVVKEGVPALVSCRPDPETASAGSELGRAIRECLASLVAPRREAVSLWLLGYGHDEIARRLGWNRKRAENLVTRGRQNLRDGLVRRGFSV
jgi:RNA polymerase sigma-70 factor (ECF subfamily)